MGIMLFMLSAVVRLLIILLLEEACGDGPYRMKYAYLWAKNPSIQWYGVWPPGFMYLGGIFNLIFSNALYSTRILNVILGSLTIPFFYLLVSRVYAHRTALLSAGVLMLFPLHVALSGTSLTEVSFVFEAIAGIYFLIIGSESSGSRKFLYLSLSIALLSLSTMTRYEAWLLIPLSAIYYALKTRRTGETFLILLFLMAFPIAWIAGNIVHTGSILPVYDEAIMGDKFQPTFVIIIRKLTILSSKYIGWFFLFAAAFGLLARLFHCLKNRLNAQEGLYLGTLCGSMGFMLKFALERQEDLMGYGRYFLFIYVLLIPLALLPFRRYLNKSWHMATVLFVFMAVSIAIGSALNKPPMYLTREHPYDIKEFAVWLKSSDYVKDNLFVAEFNEELALYHPDVSSLPVGTSNHYIPVMKAYWKIKRPSLFLMHRNRPRNKRLKSFIEEQLALELGQERLVYEAGSLQAYDLTGVNIEEPSSGEIKYFKKHDYTGGLFGP